MLPGPIFNIEMLTGSRRSRLYCIRVIYAAILLLTLWTQYPGNSYRPPGSPDPSIAELARFASTFFITFSSLQVLMVLIVGPALVAPTISVERERRTIEYLFATDLTNSEIIFGKLLARVLGIASIFLVGLPVLALAGLLGGIDPGRLLISFAITASTMLAVAALSIAVSVQAARVRDAIGQVYVILIALLLIPIIVQAVAMNSGYYDWLAPINDRFIEANPITVLTRTVVLGMFRSSPWSAVGALVLNQTVFAAALTAASVWRLRRVQAAEKVGGAASGSIRRWKLARRRTAVTDRPILWKERGDNSFWDQGVWSRIVTALVGLLLVWPIATGFYDSAMANGLWIQDDNPNRFDPFQDMSAAILTMALCGGMLLIGVRSSCSITGEREKDTWISVLGTPLPAREIVLGKILGNLNIGVGLFCYCAFVTLLRVLCLPQVALCIPFSLLTGGILLLFCSTLRVYVSLLSRSTMRAMATATAVLVFLGGGYLFCCAPFMISGGRGGEIILTPCAPFLIVISLAIGRLKDFSGPGSMEALVPYTLGTFGYAVATGMLYAACVSRFDELNGRVVSANDDDLPEDGLEMLGNPKKPLPARDGAMSVSSERPDGDVADNASSIY